MRLSTRFFISHALVGLLAVAACLLMLWGAARWILTDQVHRRQEARLQAFTLAAHEADVAQDELAVVAFMRETLKDPAVACARWARQGKPAITQPKGMEAAHLPEEAGMARAELGTGGVEVWTAGYAGAAGAGGRVQLAYLRAATKDQVDGQLAAWRRPAAAAAALALLMAAAAALFAGRQMARPLRRIAEGTRDVRDGRLDSLVQLERRDEIGDLARDFNAMCVQLKELDAMKRDFVSGVTHDLGTPLQAIRSASNAMQSGRAGALTHKQSEYLLMISNHVEGLSAFITNLLSVARIEAGKVEPYFETFDAGKVVGEWVKNYRAQAEEKGVILCWDCKTRDARIHADMIQFRQMFANLLSNALKFTQEGEVRVELLSSPQWLILKVSDTGIGIDPKYHQLIFDRFFRVRQPKGAPARQGTGLGLAIVKGLADAHGGKVGVQSALDKGSTFILELPRRL